MVRLCEVRKERKLGVKGVEVGKDRGEVVSEEE